MGKLHDALSIIHWNGLEARGEWSKELGDLWDTLGTLLAMAMDKAEEEMNEKKRLSPARSIVQKAYGED